MNDNTEKLLKQIRFLLIVLIALFILRDKFLFETAIQFVLICGVIYGILRFFEYLVGLRIAHSGVANEPQKGEGSNDNES